MTAFLLLAFQLAALSDQHSHSNDEWNIQKIKAQWLATESKIESCQIRWVEQRTSNGVQGPKRNYSLSLQGPNNLRLERKSIPQINGDAQPNTKTYLTTYDGSECRSFYITEQIDEKNYPRGFVSYSASDWDNYHVLPLLNTFCPLNRFFAPVNQCDYVVSEDTFEIAGQRTLELRPCPPQETEYIYYVDPEQDCAIVRMVFARDEQPLWQLDINHRFHEKLNCWIPSDWRLSNEREKWFANSELREQSFGQKLEPNTFRFEFPQNALVTDRTFVQPRVYLICDKQRKRIVSSQERKDGIDYLQLVDTVEKELQDNRENE